MKRNRLLSIVLSAVVLLASACQAPLDPGIGQGSARAVAAPQWDKAAIYLKSNLVSWNGHNWEAQWWTQGEEPGTTGEWGVWRDQGAYTGGGSIDTVAPSAPGTPVISSISANSASVSWTAATDNVGVSAYLLVLGGAAAISVTGTSWQASGLNADSDYTVSIKAVDAAGNQGVSVSASFRTAKVGTPSDLPSAPAWSALVAYTTDQKVCYDGIIYQARWWTQGDLPSAGSAVWKLIGPGQIDTTIPVPETLPDFGSVGVPKQLSDADIQTYWGGIDSRYLPAAVANSVQSLLPQSSFEAIFPYRYGSSAWMAFNNQSGVTEYYAHANLVQAVKNLAGVMLMVESRGWAQRITRLDKATKTAMILRMDADITADYMLAKPLVRQVVDYGKFLNEGTDLQRKRDLAAFLGNISHETTGGWDTAPGGRFAWGLYYKEEVGMNDSTVGQYVAADANYPAVVGQSYHGRGPIQLSYNYNYGFMSQVLFGDKNILLSDPKKVSHEGMLGFETAIWFWMTPQSPKPACHDVMSGTWTPSAADIAANRLPGFGTTINVVNGGLEAGKPNDSRVLDRIGFYKVVCDRMGISYGENIDCFTQSPF